LQVERIDFVAIPSRDRARARAFYRDVLGLRQDEHRDLELWAGDTCLNIWEPEHFGEVFAPQTTAHLAFRVPDVTAARAELETKGVEFEGETLDTGVCHMAFFRDPDGNALMLHRRYASYGDGSNP
jgi:catechol 2,3-dioxygenase-like lactoylglutathione lyase family enzyme